MIAYSAQSTGDMRELYDVVALQQVRRPMALGFKSDEIERLITTPPAVE